MATKCVNTSEKDFKQVLNSLRSTLKQAKIPTEGLSKIEVDSVLTGLATKYNLTPDALLSPTSDMIHLIDDAITEARNRRTREQQKLEEMAENKLGEATYIIGAKNDKNYLRKNKDTLQIYTENLQAYNAIAPEEERVMLDGLISPEGGVTLDVKYTSALHRTDSNGTPNPNAIGLVTKLNAQGKDGKWIKEEGVFPDTDEAFEAFKKVNGMQLDKIRKVLGMNSPEEAIYKKVHIVERMALDNAGLPERFAKALAEMIEDKLGLESRIMDSELGSKNNKLYGIEIKKPISLKQSGTKKSSGKKTTAKKEASDSKKALESTKTERPAIQDVGEETLDRNILINIIPDIAKRRARANYISNMFSQMLTIEVDTLRAKLNSKPEDELTDDEYEAKLALNRGTEEQQRVFALGFVTPDGRTLATKILNNVRGFFQNVISIYDSNDQDAINGLINALYFRTTESGEDVYANTFMAEEFEIECVQNGIKSKRDKMQAANLRLGALSAAFKTIFENEGAFEALIQEAAPTIEFTENIRLSADLSTPIETADDTSNDDDEGSVENRSGISHIKMKLLDPAKTLSTRMKSLLGKQYKQVNTKKGITYMLDDLGQRVRMDAGVVYYKLMDVFCNMNKPEDFMKYLDEAVVKYPWLAGIKGELSVDTDLRNEFYRAFRKVFVRYAKINPKGMIHLNSEISTVAFLDDLARNYEGGIPIGQNSVYTDTGERDENNVRQIIKFFTAPKGVGGITLDKDRLVLNEEYIKKAPYLFIKQALNSKTLNLTTVKAALDLLRGEFVYPSERGKENPSVRSNFSLEATLKNLGIDPVNVNIQALLPYISEEEWTNIETLDELDEVFTPEQRAKIQKVLTAIKGIADNYKDGGHLINDTKSYYLMICNALPMYSEGYSLASFRHDGKSRYSYSVPDFISTMTGIISKTDTKEDLEFGTQYMEENYGQYDFFKNPVTGEWMCPTMEDFNETVNGNLTDRAIEIRKNFSYVNVLSVGDGANDTIGRADDATFTDAIICSFFLGKTSRKGEDGLSFGYYRNPLFSDVDALVLFKMRKFTNLKTYKGEVLKRLAKVFRQELKRIEQARGEKKGTGVNVEFYKKNADKFCFFTEFKGHEDEILDHLKWLAENSTSYNKAKEEFIEQLLDTGSYEDSDGQSIRLGNGLGMKFLNFMDGISRERKLKLYDRILHNINESAETDEIEESKEDAKPKSINLDTKHDPAEKKAEEDKKVEQVDKWLEMFYYNDYFAQSQLIQLLFGDLAYSKNIRDFIKRNKQAYAAGERLYARDENGDPLMERAAYLEDEYMVSNGWNQIKTLLKSSPMHDIDKSLINGALEAFKGICGTDGQSFRHPKSYKKLFIAMGGKWTDHMEEALDRLSHGKFNSEDFLALWNPIKPFLFSHETKTINGRNEKVVAQHKNSEYLISALWSVLNTSLNKSPRLAALQKFMEKHNIDVVHFHSVVKVGYHSGLSLEQDIEAFNLAKHKNNGNFKINDKVTLEDITSYAQYKKELGKALFDDKISQDEYNNALRRFSYDHIVDVVPKSGKEEAFLEATNKAYESLEKQACLEYDEDENKRVYNPDVFHEFPIEDYMIVQPSDDHLTDTTAVFGSQLRNIIPADIPEGFTMTIKVNGEPVTLNRKEAIKYYNMLIVDQLIDSFSQIDEKFSNIKNLKAMLDVAIEGNPMYGEDVRAALELNDDGTAFKLPFNSPNLTNKIEALILSVFEKNIQRQDITGGNVVLVSNFGLSDNLHVKYKNDNPEEGVEYIPAYMPASKKSMYEDYLIEVTEDDGNGGIITYWQVDFDRLKANNEEDLLNVIGYRIPTEDKYSIMPIRIVGFMPITAGTTIMLPSDIIAMSGTDFDIDKLFLMLKSTRREVAGRELVDAFQKWCDDNHKSYNAAWDNILIGGKYTDKALDEERDYGFTDAELRDLIDENKTFYQFMEDEGTDLLINNTDYPRYVIQKPRIVRKSDGSMDLDETSKMSGIKNLRTKKAIRNNMLIDAIWGILTSPEGSRLSMTPASYDNAKHSSRQQRIAHDPAAFAKFYEVYKEEIDTDGFYKVFNSLTIKELDEFMEQYGHPDDPMDLSFYVTTHRNLMDGNDLIGFCAVSSSNHYKYQFTSLTVNKDNQFNITVPGFDTLRVVDVSKPRSPLTKLPIGRTHSEFQAASPDNGKDPVLGDLGCNSMTMSRVSFLCKIGLTPQMIGWLNTVDDLAAYGAEFKTDDITDKDVQDWSGDLEKIISMAFKLRTEGKIENPVDQRNAAIFSMWMSNIKECATALNAANCFMRSDSPNGALKISAAEGIQQLLKVKDFELEASSPDYPIQGFNEDFIDLNLKVHDYNGEGKEVAGYDTFRREVMNKPVPRLQAFYSLGIGNAFSLCARYLPSTTSGVLNAVQKLRAETNDNYKSRNDSILNGSSKHLKSFLSELNTFILTMGDSIFAVPEAENGERKLMSVRNYYIHDFPAKYKAFLEEKDDKGNYVHEDVRNMTLIKMITNASEKGIRFFNVGGHTTPLARKYFMEDLESLLKSEDKDVRDFAQDLFLYAYYDSGLSFGHSNYGIFFTTAFMLSMPRYIDRLVAANGRMVSDSEKMFDRFIYQYLLNHPKLLTRVQPNFAKDAKDFSTFTITFPKKSATYSRLIIGNNVPVKYVYASTPEGLAVYKVRTDNTGRIDLSQGERKVYFDRVSFNKGMLKTQGAPYYDAELDADKIEWDKLEDRGTVVDSKSLEKATKADKKKETKKKEGKDPSPIAEEKLQKDEKDTTKASIVLGLEEDDSAKQGLSSSLDALEVDPLPDKAVDIARLLNTFESETKDINDNSVPKEKNLNDFTPTDEEDEVVCEKP